MIESLCHDSGHSDRTPARALQRLLLFGRCAALMLAFPGAGLTAEVATPGRDPSFRHPTLAVDHTQVAPPVPEAHNPSDPSGRLFLKGQRTLGATFGLGLHVGNAKDDIEHELGLVAVQWTHNLSGVLGQSRFYQGNLQLVGELFGGGQFTPDSAYLIGALPSLRYNLNTGTRWTPFIEAGAGICFTDIGRPDLSTTFQFVEQGGIGLRWACRKSLAMTVEARLMHVSNAGIKQPNDGVNTINLQFGLHRLF